MAKLLLQKELNIRFPYVLITPEGEKFPVGSESLAERICKFKGWDLTKEF